MFLKLPAQRLFQIKQQEREVVRGEIITMSTDAINTAIEMPGWTPEEAFIRWTRLADCSYLKEGNLKVPLPTCTITALIRTYPTLRTRWFTE
jgi:hypothetical protein